MKIIKVTGFTVKNIFKEANLNSNKWKNADYSEHLLCYEPQYDLYLNILKKMFIERKFGEKSPEN